ncbi:Cmx/CmrA family chloramphenicol efflux MFS transporter [Nocardia donostiensis]|uniref:Chloramphenicol efflux pump n=1 Tax=Nocardia donostiensis TaxID=1538463 RepID=A0A1V2TKJ1_9NOCA|nr:Cmx/CmrA family chloramphenicol efflux MFS transporter [Nocardia donostiensis]ONM49973.1 chloramphenicol efflux pump [Nocardia donostiensis]OQS13459.1 chloramphenicol efflux pump [Nocardia donostiensis]OQS22263.1 chloramphenicol efflux pump [Nocardia donostiensis]
MPAVVFVLAVAVFAQGTSEFMVSGLLEQITGDVGVSLGAAGLLTSLFAAGMVLGAPVMAITAGRLPVRYSVAAFLGLFCAAHVVGAASSGFAVLLVTRVVAALANAGFLAIVLAALPRLVGPARLGRASSVVVSGVTVACVAGVPAGTLLGQVWGWRSAFWAVAALSAAVLVPVWVMLGRDMRDGDTSDGQARSMRSEWSVLRQRPVLIAVVTGVLVNAATFAGFTYLGTITTSIAGGARWVPVVLALFGVGSFLGVVVTGRYSDRHQRRIIVAGAVVLVGVWLLAAAVAAHSMVGVMVMSVVAGAVAFGVGSTLIATIVQTATPVAPRIAGALATTAFNVGAALGPATAGLVVDRIGHPSTALWCSAAFTAAAVGVAVMGWRRRVTSPVEQVRVDAR